MDYAVILAGGVGSRFWPLSRRLLPKQFLKIAIKKSFLKNTIDRIRPLIPSKNIFIVTNQIYLKELKAQLKTVNLPVDNIILEPKPLNTLPALTLCAWLIKKRDKQANLLVMPTDHYIKDRRLFREGVLKALNLSSRGFISLIGIRPDSPCEGYGYIKIGKRIDKDSYSVRSFKEKPTLNSAKKLFKRKDIFWNSGIFSFQAETILREVQTYLPGLYSQIARIRRKADIAKIWQRIKPVSIDYGLLEKSDNLVMVKAGFYWRDLGSWDTLSGVLAKDKKGNVILSECVNLESKNILVYSDCHKRLIATLGLENTIIVDTADALLVCKKEKSQDIKHLVEILKKKRKKCV